MDPMMYETQTSYVSGWMITLPLLLAAALLVWAFIYPDDEDDEQ